MSSVESTSLDAVVKAKAMTGVNSADAVATNCRHVGIVLVFRLNVDVDIAVLRFGLQGFFFNQLGSALPDYCS